MPAVGRADETDLALALSPLYTGTILAEETDVALRPGSAPTARLRTVAFTFKQDDHEFYGLQLGNETILWDALTSQWCQWTSPTFNYWRVSDTVDWEGYNLAGDTESGVIWKLDPTNRLDYGDTPIVSIVTGYLTQRMRTNIQCYMAQLALSAGDPPPGFSDGQVGITLETSTDNGQNYINHGEVAGGGINEKIAVRWYGLGLMRSPGTLFRLTDTGYARRIDGLNIETNETGEVGG